MVYGRGKGKFGTIGTTEVLGKAIINRKVTSGL